MRSEDTWTPGGLLEADGWGGVILHRSATRGWCGARYWNEQSMPLSKRTGNQVLRARCIQSRNWTYANTS